MKTVAVLVNPKSGYGIKINMPGSDSIEKYDPLESTTVRTAIDFLSALRGMDLDIISSENFMGGRELREAGIGEFRTVYHDAEITCREDTLNFIRIVSSLSVDIIIFFGGDGTAADISSVIDGNIPVLGIPTGVKMHSAVFAISPQRALRTLQLFVEGSIGASMEDVVDADEPSLLNGVQNIRVKGRLLVPASEDVILESKREFSDPSISGAIEYLQERMDPSLSYLIGPGSTCKMVTSLMDISTPVYGVDIISGGKLIVSNASLEVLEDYTARHRCKLILTPIGGQGILIGRGNRQLSEKTLSSISDQDLLVISSMEKLSHLAHVVIQYGFPSIAYLKILYGYGRFKVVPVLHG